jgi:hypothetical protein
MQGGSSLQYIRIAVLAVFISLPIFAGEADTLLFTTPLSASGYSGTGVRKTGGKLPLWLPPSDKTVRRNDEKKVQSVIAAGRSNLGWSVTFAKYPQNILSSAQTFSFYHENSSGRIFAQAALGDSLFNVLSKDTTNHLPIAIDQKTSLDHIRMLYDLRLNVLPMLSSFDFLPFPINVYAGAGVFTDFSFGVTNLKIADSTFRADSSSEGFDSTNKRFIVDVGLAFPIGLEVFPFKNRDIPVLKNLGISVSYTIYQTFRAFAMPDKDVNPYKKYVDKSDTSSIAGINGNSNGDGISSGGNSDKNKGVSDYLWYGWARISAKNELRVCLVLLF